VICERSCRMAKTLCVTIPQILKNKSEKRKKIEKKIHFSVFFAKKKDNSVLYLRSLCRENRWRHRDSQVFISFAFSHLYAFFRANDSVFAFPFFENAFSR
jgi:hypothetical protein